MITTDNIYKIVDKADKCVRRDRTGYPGEMGIKYTIEGSTSRYTFEYTITIIAVRSITIIDNFTDIIIYDYLGRYTDYAEKLTEVLENKTAEYRLKIKNDNTIESKDRLDAILSG